MKFVYYDLPTNMDIYLQDAPCYKVRACFIDNGDVFVYFTDDGLCKSYINQVIDPHKKPHIYFHSNLKAIEDDEQFALYESFILGNTNYHAGHKGEKVDGTQDGTWDFKFQVDQNEISSD